LVVPVIRDATGKASSRSRRRWAISPKLARDGKLKPDQMQGGSFTISSLGGIGGTYFTPIINAPEVAILGVCRSFWKQVSADGKSSSWRFSLPLSLSWDHRVIDGASRRASTATFASLLGDMRRVPDLSKDARRRHAAAPRDAGAVRQWTSPSRTYFDAVPDCPR
jgi:pyruvate dehydrogenase E2 component (dihydrolipoamide acetyltransferase)